MRKKTQSVNSKIKNAQRINVNGIQFRSKLEAFCYKKLLEEDINNFDYETKKFILKPSFIFSSNSMESYERKDRDTDIKLKGFDLAKNNIREITYLPDFTCIDEDTKTGWIIECKGYSNDSFPMKWKMFKHLLEEEGYNVSLYLPNNQGNILKTIKDIKEKYYN